MESRAEVAINRAAAAAVGAGHPWVWARAVTGVRGSPGSGDRVAVTLHAAPIGFGYFDPGAAIRVRILSQVSHGAEDDALAEAIAAAMALRARDPRLAGAEALRLVHGECDFLPGLVIDRYGPALVARYDGAGAEALWRRFEPALIELAASAGFEATGVFVRGRGVVAGELAARLVIAEGRAIFEVDLEHGHKTGLFLDQRPNRERVGQLASGASVLNLFGYTGGFSIHAQLGGAREIVTVDSAAPAIEAAGRNVAASGLDPEAHSLICADAFEFLRSGPGRFDVVVCDPPSFAPNRKSVPKASKAYRLLNQLAARAVVPGGLLVTASCSSHVGGALFAELVAEGMAAAGRRGVVIERGGAGGDHPIRPGFPEGEYLTVLYVVLD